MAPVDPLDPSVYLDAYRRSVAISPTAKCTNLASVRARLVAGEVIDEGLEAEPATGRANSRRAAAWLAAVKPVALSVGIATAGVGVVKTVALTWHALAPDRERDPAAEGAGPMISGKRLSQRLSPDPRSAVEAPELAVAVPVAAVEVTKAVPQPSKVPVSARPQLRRRPAPEAAQAPSLAPEGAPVDDLLQRETALMSVGKDQLSAGQWGALLVTLAEHAAQFPEGSMKPERQAWEAISRCSLHDARGTSVGEAFVIRNPHSTLADKVRRACGLAPK